jgi:hypothetical protein
VSSVTRVTAEFAQGGPARLLRRHAALDIVLGISLDMIANVPIKIFQRARSAGQWHRRSNPNLLFRGPENPVK